MNNKKLRPTSYIVMYWNTETGVKIKEEVYPMHKYTFTDIAEKLRGIEEACDIYECRYSKAHRKYVTVGKTYIWNLCNWIEMDGR